MIKDEQPDGEVYRAHLCSLESPKPEVSALWSWDVPPSQHMDMFINLEALQTLYFGNFYGSFMK